MSKFSNDEKKEALNTFLKYRQDINPYSSLEESWGMVLELRKSHPEDHWSHKVRRTSMREAITLNYLSVDADDTLVTRNNKLAKDLQKSRDIVRVANKERRELFRGQNVVESLNAELVEALSKVNIPVASKKHTPDFTKPHGVITLSDIHFNELIDIKKVNYYDFHIASKRLHKLANKARKIFKDSGVTEVAVMGLGDWFNKDDIDDKKLNNAQNRTEALVLGLSIIQQFLLDLNEDFNIKLFGVIGNESRLTEKIGWSDVVASDNYDWLCYRLLSMLNKNGQGIEVYLDNKQEQLIEINNSNILIMHGHQNGFSNPSSMVSKITSKYANQYDEIVDYVFFGHLHQALVSDRFARSASVCGQNSYADKALQLCGRASQLVSLFYSGKSHDVVKVDLQHTEGYAGYYVDSNLERYNPKCGDKLSASVKFKF